MNTYKHHINDKKTNCFPSKIKNKTTSTQHRMRVSRQYNKAKNNNNKIKSIQSVKDKVTLPVFTDDMIICKENPMGSMKNLLELMNELNKIAKYKINTQKSVSFLCTSDNQLESTVKKNAPLMMASKNKN